MEYLIIEIVCFLITFGVHKYYKVKLFRAKSQMITFWVLTFLLGTLWDQFAVYRGHWFYPGKGLIGLNIGLMPFEDYIFIFVVAYAILVMYQVSNKMVDMRYKSLNKRTK
ncbi:MAG: lycopene cyclase domain-containing protein [Candidatus Nanoarchaeia archaeon]|nr:lycopene cyclase domain-containing protein [Candidatus Nanoarchaeia archaeon]